jgi:hypothetical protein
MLTRLPGIRKCVEILNKGILTALIIRDINGLHFGYSHTPTKKALRYETIYD